MSRWIHPDRLDRVAAAGDPDTGARPASRAQVEQVLAKVLVTGRLQRIPRKPEHRDIVLGMLCTGLLRRYAYTEPELNERLKEKLEAMNADVDHVTCRRLMVDVGFLKRDRAGTRYFLNHHKLQSTLSEDTAATTTELLHNALEHRR